MGEVKFDKPGLWVNGVYKGRVPLDRHLTEQGTYVGLDMRTDLTRWLTDEEFSELPSPF